MPIGKVFMYNCFRSLLVSATETAILTRANTVNRLFNFLMIQGIYLLRRAHA